MGIGPRLIGLLRALKADGERAFADGNWVCELGAQVIQPKPDPLSWTNAAVLYKELKLHYRCIDMNGKFGALQLDLNVCKAGGLLERRFNVVTNFGTSEHIFNQVNCFQLMHDLCLPDGLMLHCSPAMPSTENCLYYYNSEFHRELAAANSYEVVKWNYELQGTNASVLAFLRKLNDAPFRMPIQSRYL